MGTNEQSSVEEEVSTLTPAQDIELRRMNPNGDGFIAPRQARAEARVAAELRSSNARLWKIMFGILGLLSLSWFGNAGLTAAVVILSKDLKVEGGTLKNMNGDPISTLGQKNVYEVTLVKVTTRRALGEQGSGGTHENPTVVAQVTCANVLEAISSIEKGNDGSLVKMSVGDGKFWEPRMSAASYNLHENSFGIEQIYLDDQRDVSYDVTCEISKAVCESTPDSLCDAVKGPEVITLLGRDDRRALSFEDAFDGEVKVQPRRLDSSKAYNCMLEGMTRLVNANTPCGSDGDFSHDFPPCPWECTPTTVETAPPWGHCPAGTALTDCGWPHQVQGVNVYTCCCGYAC